MESTNNHKNSAGQSVTEAAQAGKVSAPTMGCLELVERRRSYRTLPVPEAVELDVDSGWALWRESMTATLPTQH